MNGIRDHPPVISSYAAGPGDRRGPSSARRSGDRRAASLLGTVGTASAVAIVAIGGTLAYLNSNPVLSGLASEPDRALQHQGAGLPSQIGFSSLGDSDNPAVAAVIDSRVIRPLPQVVTSELPQVVSNVLPQVATSESSGAAGPPIRQHARSVKAAGISLPAEPGLSLPEEPALASEGMTSAFVQSSPGDRMVQTSDRLEVDGNARILVVGEGAALAGISASEASALRESEVEPEAELAMGDPPPILPRRLDPALIAGSGELLPDAAQLVVDDDSGDFEPAAAAGAEAASLALLDRGNDLQAVAQAAPSNELEDPIELADPNELADLPLSSNDVAFVGDTISRHIRSLEDRYGEAAPNAPEGVSRSTGEVTGGSEASAQRMERLATFSAGASDLGASTVLIQDEELVAIKLADLISLFESQLDRSLFVWLSSSDNASKYVTPASLQAAGIEAAFDPRKGQVVLSVPEE